MRGYNISEIINGHKDEYKTVTTISGWVRTVRVSSSELGFCNINDGSNVSGLQLILTPDELNNELFDKFFKEVNIGMYLNCIGTIIESPADGQKYEMRLNNYNTNQHYDENYPLIKSKMNMDTLRNYIHLRGRTNAFGSIFRIRSSLIKIIHDYYHSQNYLNLDPNIITTNECEGGAGVFQLTENNITNIDELPRNNLSKKYDWNKDHFCKPVYLTVSSQLQLEAMACCLGNVYTMNKSFRSEHSATSKHVSEFTHVEIEIINNTLSDLMTVGENTIKFAIEQLFERNLDDLENLNKFISKGLIDRLKYIKDVEFKRMTYTEAVNIINNDFKLNKKEQIEKIEHGDDLSSVHENYITTKYNCPVFITHWPSKIKSFYMKQCNDGTCESFDLLMPYGIGELIGASQREDDYEKLFNVMREKNIDPENLSFYLDLRKYGSCPHGGFGLGFDRLLMLVTGITNIKDVIPFPVFYKGCKY